jgi:hypothetical protein
MIRKIILLLFIASSGYAQTAGRIIPDNYPVTNDMLKGNYGKKQSGDLISFDKAWYTNDTLGQTLVIELYTDYHRFQLFHFYNNDIPESLIDRMEFNFAVSKSSYDTASSQKKQELFPGFLTSGTKIAQRYFTTEKGFRLGDKKDKAIKNYGQPDTCYISNGIETCEWRFKGDYTDEETPLPISKKPLAEKSFGYGVTMYFRKEKLIAMILFKDIP